MNYIMYSFVCPPKEQMIAPCKKKQGISKLEDSQKMKISQHLPISASCGQLICERYRIDNSKLQDRAHGASWAASREVSGAKRSKETAPNRGKAGGDGFLLLRTPCTYNKKLINIRLYVWGLHIY